MRRYRNLNMALASLAIAACVTINVYFPAASAEKAADQIIDTVTSGSGSAAPAPASTPPATPPQTRMAPQAPAGSSDAGPASTPLALLGRGAGLLLEVNSRQSSGVDTDALGNARSE